MISLKQSKPGKGLPIILITAGFSQEANAHVSATVALLESMETKQQFNFVQPVYSQQVKDMQDNAVFEDKKTGTQQSECHVYSMVADMIADMISDLPSCNDITIIAKSAGASVCMMLPERVDVSAYYILAPAPISVDIPMRAIPLFIGWSVNDPKISYKKHFQNTVSYLARHQYVMSTMTFVEATHDFTKEFVVAVMHLLQ